jgi:hypothetical protein
MSIDFKFVAFADPHKILTIHSHQCGHVFKNDRIPVEQKYFGCLSLGDAQYLAKKLGYKYVECTVCNPSKPL